MNPYLDTHKLAELQAHYTDISHTHMRELFTDDPQRFANFSLQAPHLFLDYSKNCIVPETMQLLVELAKGTDLNGYIDALFSGGEVNVTEGRPALHTALRDTDQSPLIVNGVNIKEKISDTLVMMRYFVSKLRAGEWRGFAKNPMTDVVHIGIGGSYLGPKMAVEALAPSGNIKCHFVSSLDAADLDQTLRTLNPKTTLFIIASKTFATQETLVNAQRAKQWIVEAAGKESKHINCHFVAVTADTKKAMQWGLPETHIFPCWDWVGGRFSLWSTMGLVIAISAGMDHFEALLSGAHEMDNHFQHTAFEKNMPVVLALLSFWHTAFFNASTHAVLPYSHHLCSLPRYLQQLSMESNGKSVQYGGAPVEIPSAPILFGEAGTEGQHSFHQLLFQGTHLVPCDFIAVVKHPVPEAQQPLLLSHCFAQSRALMLGKTHDEVMATLLKQGLTQEMAEKLAPHKVVLGNQPSNTILLPELTPASLGALVALYEHKTFVEGVLWSINSFDQFGVELGKELVGDMTKRLVEGDETVTFDASTEGLLAYCQGGK
jgi:glucose-6-phosphate isomerase